MAQVCLQNVSKIFAGDAAVAPTELTVADGEFLVLVGPSGCGKTTLLRMVAGLEEPSTGRIYIGGRDVTAVAPKDRDVAMVFQNYALYPHMTVYGNMAYSLRLRRLPSGEIAARVNRAATMLGLGELLTRYPRQLSGGQQQRVALGRAIVRQPQVFLMDEPLSNLDAKLRVQTRAELIKLHRQLQATFIYVTHDQVEAMTMGSRIAVLHAGAVQQVGTPGEIYRAPANMFVAGFIGSPPMHFLRGELESQGGGVAVFRAAGAVLTLRGDMTRLADAASQVCLGVRPENLVPAPPGAAGGIPVTVEIVENIGAESLVHLRTTGREELVMKLPSVSAPPAADSCLTVAPGRQGLYLFDACDGRSLGEFSAAAV